MTPRRWLAILLGVVLLLVGAGLVAIAQMPQVLVGGTPIAVRHVGGACVYLAATDRGVAIAALPLASLGAGGCGP